MLIDLTHHIIDVGISIKLFVQLRFEVIKILWFTLLVGILLLTFSGHPVVLSVNSGRMVSKFVVNSGFTSCCFNQGIVEDHGGNADADRQLSNLRDLSIDQLTSSRTIRVLSED